MQLHYTNVSPEEAILKIAMIHTVIILEDPSVAPDQNISGRFTLICPVSQENKQGSYLSHNGHLLTVIWKLNLSLQLYSSSSLKEDIAALDTNCLSYSCELGMIWIS